MHDRNRMHQHSWGKALTICQPLGKSSMSHGALFQSCTASAFPNPGDACHAPHPDPRTAARLWVWFAMQPQCCYGSGCCPSCLFAAPERDLKAAGSWLSAFPPGLSVFLQQNTTILDGPDFRQPMLVFSFGLLPQQCRASAPLEREHRGGMLISTWEIPLLLRAVPELAELCQDSFAVRSDWLRTAPASPRKTVPVKTRGSLGPGTIPAQRAGCRAGPCSGDKRVGKEGQDQ